MLDATSGLGRISINSLTYQVDKESLISIHATVLPTLCVQSLLAYSPLTFL